MVEEVQVDLDVMKMVKQMFIHCCIDQVLEIKMHVSMVKMHATVVNAHVTVVIRHVTGKQKWHIKLKNYVVTIDMPDSYMLLEDVTSLPLLYPPKTS